IRASGKVSVAAIQFSPGVQLPRPLAAAGDGATEARSRLLSAILRQGYPHLLGLPLQAVQRGGAGAAVGSAPAPVGRPRRCRGGSAPAALVRRRGGRPPPAPGPARMAAAAFLAASAPVLPPAPASAPAPAR